MPAVSYPKRMKPFSTSSPNKYCRLLAPREPLADPANAAFVQALLRLGRSMRDDGTRLSESPEILVSPGYTYFGQLVDHDLTEDRTNLLDSWNALPESITNYATPRLDLDNLYGRGAHDGNGYLFVDGIRFKVEPAGSKRHSFDVGMDGEKPLLGDSRSAENVILREMIAFFARLHNFAVGQFAGSIGDSENLFARARLQTVWQYQWLIYTDYLSKVLDWSVYRQVLEQRSPMISWDVFSTPIEFAVAAMRFGHSMVRRNYLMSIGRDKDLLEIMSRSRQPGTLEDEWEIDWGRYFQGASTVPTMAMTSRPIDARIIEPLFHVPAQTFQLFSAARRSLGVSTMPDPTSQTSELPVVSLVRGAGLHLASGQSAAAALGEPELTEAELTQDRRAGARTAAGAILLETRMTGGSDTGTPLWYYLLKESEVRNNGNRLGPTGSRIVAETVYAALLHDPDSFINRPDAGPHPPIWKLRGNEIRITHLNQLFRLACEMT